MRWDGVGVWDLGSWRVGWSVESVACDCALGSWGVCGVVYEGRVGKEVGESVACDACVRWVGGVGWDGMELGWDGVGLNRGVTV